MSLFEAGLSSLNLIVILFFVRIILFAQGRAALGEKDRGHRKCGGSGAEGSLVVVVGDDDGDTSRIPVDPPRWGFRPTQRPPMLTLDMFSSRHEAFFMGRKRSMFQIMNWLRANIVA